MRVPHVCLIFGKREESDRENWMTVAIGAYYRHGIVVCADTNVVATDLIVTSGCKISGRTCNGRSYVIAMPRMMGTPGARFQKRY